MCFMHLQSVAVLNEQYPQKSIFIFTSILNLYERNIDYCQCKSGFYLSKAVSSLSSLYTCDACAAGTTSSADHSFCITCATNTTCQDCPAGEIRLDRDVTGAPLAQAACSACPSFAYPSSDGSTCVRCPESIMTATLSNGKYTCSCPTNTYNAAPSNGSCIVAAAASKINFDYPPGNVGLLRYSNIVTSTTVSALRSEIIVSTFLRVAAKCRYEGNEQACQALANMCVWQEYDYLVSYSSCKFYAEVANSKGAIDGDFADWPQGMPWLYYGMLNIEDAGTTLSKNIGVSFSTYPEISNNKLKFVLAKYTWDGVYVGLEQLTDQFQFCPLDYVKKVSFVGTGNSLNNTCSVNLKYAMNSTNANFYYDMYIVDDSGNLAPVPVKMET